MKKIIATITAALALAGCYVPEQFFADVKFNEKGGYSVKFDGTVINGNVLMYMAKVKRPLDSKENAEVETKEKAAWGREKGVKANYKGNGRTHIQTELQRGPGQRLDLLEMLSISTDKNGVTTISSPKVSPKNKKMLADAGVKIKGGFTVVLPKNAEIISHNADSTPSLFGLFGTYKWNVADVDKAPQMKVRFK